MHQGKNVVVLAIEIQQPCRAIGITIGDFEIFRQRDSTRKHGVNIARDSFSRINVGLRLPQRTL
jgi:hypothetical protein